MAVASSNAPASSLSVALGGAGTQNPPMRRVIVSLLFYFCAIVLLSILLTPPIWWLVDHFSHGHVPVKRVFNRTLMVAAMALLWPLARYLKLADWRRCGLFFQAYAFSCVWPWFALGCSSIAVLYAGQGMAGLMIWQPHLNWRNLAGYGLSAVLVALLEETMFRGVLFLAFLRRNPTGNIVQALLGSVFFATAHFLKAENPSLPVSWGTGLEIWHGMALHLLNPREFFMHWLTLFLAGLLLCAVAWRYGHLWAAMGLHAGWVFSLKTFNQLVENRPSDAGPWFSRDVMAGAWADIVLIVLLVLVLNFRRNETLDRKLS
ncbi:MAG: CPBP family intramembrane metalloprotease [Methylacidiphilales bacterium]|nr:CPBP family intramembrane metalloprotease [Candidatus Methylacidiphilales bacterium]